MMIDELEAQVLAELKASQTTHLSAFFYGRRLEDGEIGGGRITAPSKPAIEHDASNFSDTLEKLIVEDRNVEQVSIRFTRESKNDPWVSVPHILERSTHREIVQRRGPIDEKIKGALRPFSQASDERLSLVLEPNKPLRLVRKSSTEKGTVELPVSAQLEALVEEANEAYEPAGVKLVGMRWNLIKGKKLEATDLIETL